MNIDQSQRLIAHLYCAAISGQQLKPLHGDSCPHWEETEEKKNRYVPTLFWGEAGVGKSQTVKWVADSLGIGFFDLRLGAMDAGDLMGLPRDEQVYPCVYDHQQAEVPADVASKRFSKSQLLPYILKHYPNKARGKKAGQIVQEAIQLAESDDYGHLIDFRMVYSTPPWFPAHGTHGILFLDEIGRSNDDIRNAVFQLILDRKMHMLELPDGWIVVAANNPPTSDYGGVDTSTDKAFQSRFMHIAMDPTVEEWLEYAYASGIDPSIRSLMRNSKDPWSMLGLPVNGVTMKESFPTPRTWVMLDHIMDGLDMDLVLEVASGLVGPSPAAAWSNLRRLPTSPVKGDEILSSYIVQQDGSLASRELRDKIFSFLDYPLPQFRPDGSPLLDGNGNQVVERNRRTDVLAITFDDLTDSLNRPSLQPHEAANLVAFLEDAFRLETDVGAPASFEGRVKEMGGLGMKDVGYQYLKLWVQYPAMASILQNTVGLLRKALEEAGQASKVAAARKGGSSRRRRTPGAASYGNAARLGVSYGAKQLETAQMAAFSFR